MAENKTYQDELVEGYDQIREQRGWSPAMMGDHLEPIDPALAAEYRSRYVTAKAAPKDRTPETPDAPKAPKGRKAPAKKTAAPSKKA